MRRLLPKFQNKYACIQLGWMILLLNAAPAAADWVIQPALQISEIYTDNIGLLPSSLESEKESEYITQIVPIMIMQHSGRRFQADINYRLQSLLYSGNRERNETFHQFEAQINSELVSDSFFFDVNASRSQQVRDPEQAISLRTVAVQGNVTDVLTASANPYYRAVFGTSGVLLLGYRHGKVDYKGNTSFLRDSELQSSYFNIGQQNTARRLNWSVDFNQDEIVFDGQVLLESGGQVLPLPIFIAETINRFERQQATLFVSLGARTVWQVLAGDESNEFDSMPGQEIDGSYWNTGIIWNGGGNNRFELSVGERFFGDTGSLKWLKSGRYMRFELEYSEELFTDAQRQLGPQMALERADSRVVVSRGSSGVYLRSRSNLTLGYNRSNSIINLMLFSEAREFQSNGELTESQGGMISWDWSIASQTRLISRAEKRYDQSIGSDREDDLSNYSFTLSRRVNSKLSMDLELGHEHLHTNRVSVNYHATSLRFGLDKRF